MDIQVIEKKLREARFFLYQMREYERLTSEDTEPFDFYLSAFLTAAMSVRGAFHYARDRERSDAVKAWKQRWESSLSPDKARLYHFMVRDRPATAYNFTIDGAQRRATEACGEYLALLGEMLATFVTRHAQDTIEQLIEAACRNFKYQPTNVESNEGRATSPTLMPLSGADETRPYHLAREGGS